MKDSGSILLGALAVLQLGSDHSGFFTDQSRGLVRFCWLEFLLAEDIKNPRIRLGLRIWICNSSVSIWINIRIFKI